MTSEVFVVRATRPTFQCAIALLILIQIVLLIVLLIVLKQIHS